MKRLIRIVLVVVAVSLIGPVNLSAFSSFHELKSGELNDWLEQNHIKLLTDDLGEFGCRFVMVCPFDKDNARQWSAYLEMKKGKTQIASVAIKPRLFLDGEYKGRLAIELRVAKDYFGESQLMMFFGLKEPGLFNNSDSFTLIKLKDLWNLNDQKKSK